MAQLERDLIPGMRAAASYPLSQACEPFAELVDLCLTVVSNTSNADRWDVVMVSRIRDTWQSRRTALVWLDDKVAQVHETSRICDRLLHLPLYAHASEGEAAEEQELRRALCECITRNDPVVVKPRHGANSCHVSLWPSPQDARE
ncbi:unnamed protein product, partial [Polarella glacialis]